MTTYRGETVDLKPTEAMATEAERGLEWRREFGRGGTDVGVARATQLKNREELSAETVRRMVSYFARHEVDKDAEGFSPGEDGYPSAGRIAWALWGGDPGQTWANAKDKRLDQIDERAKAMNTKAAPGALSVGDFVEWDSSGGMARGMIERIERDGEIDVPDSDFEIEGTEEDPAALIQIYRPNDSDGYDATETRVGHRFSALTKIESLKSIRKSVNFHLSVKNMMEEGKTLKFEGYASTFGNVDLDGDIIEHGAFKNCITQLRAKAQMNGGRKLLPVLWQHDMRNPVGIFTDMQEDERGLYVRAEMPLDDDMVRGRIAPQMRAGSVSDMSIGFMVRGDEMQGRNRIIKEAELFEISLVTIPANPMAVITSVKSISTKDLRSLDIRDIEKALRSGQPVSKDAAKLIVSLVKGWRCDDVDSSGREATEKSLDELLARLKETAKSLEGYHAS